MLGATDDPYLAWCIDEAAAIAANLLAKQEQEDRENILEGPSGKFDSRTEAFTPRDTPQRNHIYSLPKNGGTVINGSFPVKWRD